MAEDKITAEQLLRRWQSGDEDAARQLFDLYSHKLAAVAQRNLSHRLGSRVDGDDIVQSVFRTFFRRSVEGEFQVTSSTELWRLLVKITLAKVRSQARHHTTIKRNIYAETSDPRDGWFVEAMSSEPGPEEAAMMLDQTRAVLSGLPDKYADILALRLEGHARTEIADRLGVSRQTVHRVLALLQERMERLLSDTA